MIAKVCAVLALCALSGFEASSAAANPFVRMDFNFFSSRARGTVFIELFDDRPLTRDNFLAYVNGGKYDFTLMHRLARNFVLQGGGFQADQNMYVDLPAPLYTALDPARVDLDGNPATPNPTVNNEFSNSPTRSNVAGTLAMAKQGGNPNSATSEFFFNLGNSASNLDNQNGGFTVFAQVVGDGMNLINAYNAFNPTTQQYNLNALDVNFDTNGNGIHDSNVQINPDLGAFGTVPAAGSIQSFTPLVLLNADQIDYLGSGLTTDVPSGGIAFTARNAYIDTGTVFTGSGGITIGPGRTLGIREGYSLNRSLTNHGTLAPGLEVGSITVQSNYFQFSDGALAIQLGGTIADTQYDRLVTSGEAFLAGSLKVSFIPGYAPAGGSTYTVLTASGITGTFGSIDLPQLSPGLVWSASQSSTSFTLSVVGGDYNHNGFVDAADYVVWRKSQNTNVSTPYSGADGNGDSFVNDVDYTVWRNNFGKKSVETFGSGSGSELTLAGVPEPASSCLFLCGAFMFAARRNRRPSLNTLITA